MSDNIQLGADLRTDVGKGASRRLRRLADKVPGIIYGGDVDPVALTFRQNELVKAMQVEAFYSQIIDITTDGTTQQAVVRDLQRHPANEKVMHIDFLRVRADRALQVQIPIHFLNEDACVGVKTEGGQISHTMTDVEINCLPADLPEFLVVDMENVALGTALHLSDIPLPEGVTIVALMQEEPYDAQIVTVQEIREIVEEEPELEAAAEGDEVGEEGAEEGDDSAEGGADDDSGSDDEAS